MGRVVAALILAISLVVGGGDGTASAHPSDPSILTLDLLLGEQGLVKIDAAAQRATYADRPSVTKRRQLAGDVVKALAIPRNTATIATKSELYHEVGFTISLGPPFANDGERGVLVDTKRLQRIAARNGEVLKFTFGRLAKRVCRGSARTAPAGSPTSGMVVISGQDVSCGSSVPTIRLFR